MSHNKIEGNLLLDYYSSLLTDHQTDILNDYYVDDLSMQEIAENHDISKSAVSDIIKRSYEQLFQYEEKLQLVKKATSLDKLINRMEKDDKIDRIYIKELKKINRG